MAQNWGLALHVLRNWVQSLTLHSLPSTAGSGPRTLKRKKKSHLFLFLISLGFWDTADGTLGLLLALYLKDRSLQDLKNLVGGQRSNLGKHPICYTISPVPKVFTFWRRKEISSYAMDDLWDHCVTWNKSVTERTNAIWFHLQEMVTFLEPASGRAVLGVRGKEKLFFNGQKLLGRNIGYLGFEPQLEVLVYGGVYLCFGAQGPFGAGIESRCFVFQACKSLELFPLTLRWSGEMFPYNVNILYRTVYRKKIKMSSEVRDTAQ